MKCFVIATSLSLLPACTLAGSEHYQRQLAALAALADDDERVARVEQREQTDTDPFVAVQELDREALVAAVLARNPSINAARHAWRSALADFPQSTALADPMASYMFAPLSIAGDVPFGQEVMLTQPLPFPGKLERRGARVLAEADAMRGDFESTRLGLVLMASMFHAEYFANGRALAINDEHAALLAVIRGTLQARFETGDETLQGPLGAEMELADIERERVRLVADRDVVVARMNELLHRAPTAPLPPPPETLSNGEGTVDENNADALLQESIEKRPELAVVRARIKAAQAEIEMAQAESWPDFSLSASYNSMWADLPHQFMIGGSVDIPIQLGRRAAAVDQAESRRRQQDAELLARIDAVRTEVETERRRVIEAKSVLTSYDERTLPLAQALVDAAQAGVQTSRTSFLELLQAERALRTAKLERARAVAVLHEQIAKLERALGRAPPQHNETPSEGAQP